MASAKDIRFDQRNVTNTAYQEKYVNGNSLIIRTDSTGSVIGTSTLEGVPIGTITPSTANFTNVTASVISCSILIGNFSGNISGSNISASGIYATNLTSVNNNLINVTASTIVSTAISSSLYGTSSWTNNSTSASFSLSSSNSNFAQIASYTISASYSLTSSNSNFAQSASYATSANSASYLTPQNSYDVANINVSNNLTASNSNLTNITASNISASGNISSSRANFNTLSSNSSILFNLTSSNISASGQIIADGFSGSVFGTSSWSNNALSTSYFGSGSDNYFPIWSSNKLSFNSLISQSNNQIAILSDTTSFLGDALIINKSDPIYSNNNPTIDASNSPNQTLMLTPNVVIGGDGNSDHWNRFNSDGTVDFLGANIKFTSGGAAAFNSSITIGSPVLLGNNALDVIGNISASVITASRLLGTADTASYLTPTNNYTVANFTASNISASGNAELGTLSVRGNTTFYGDFTVYGTSSVVNISSSTVIIGDNRIQLNAWSTGSFSQRYAGLDLTDSGSNNTVTSSLLWDSANNYWLLTNNQTGSNPVTTSSALILQGPVSSFGNEKQLPVNTFLKVESTIGNLTSSNLSETGDLLTYNGTISSSVISASSAFFSLDVLISGVLKVFNKIYAYAGIIGDITGSLSGSNIIVNTITSSVITSSNITSTNNNLFVVTSSVISSSTLISNNNTLVNVTSSNISASGYITGSSANFNTLNSVNNILTNLTSSNISASGYISGSNVYVENTITADTGSFIYLNINNTGSAPTNYTSSGMPGEVRFDNNFIYIYTNNIWVRTPIVRWTS